MKTLKKVLFIGLMAFIVCLARTVQAQELYKNEKAPIHERIMDLLSRLTVEEKISLLRATSPGISRLDIPTKPLVLFENFRRFKHCSLRVAHSQFCGE